MFPPFDASLPRGERIFASAAFACTVAACTASHWVMQAGAVAGLLFGLAISAGSTRLVGRILEKRWLLGHSSNYWSFLYGDIALAVTMTAEASASSGHPPVHWSLAWALLAIVGSLGWRAFDATHYRSTQMRSPTKVWHDLFVIPSFVFVLGNNLLALTAHPMSWQFWIGLGGFTFWLVTMAIDATRDGLTETAHIDVHHREFT